MKVISDPISEKTMIISHPTFSGLVNYLRQDKIMSRPEKQGFNCNLKNRQKAVTFAQENRDREKINLVVQLPQLAISKIKIQNGRYYPAFT